MKRRILLSSIALCFAVLGAMAQRSYTFNAVALNVDGLPEEISGVPVNEGAPGADGATAIGNAIAMQNWDIIGLSEDFDYHENLVAPLTNYFHVGTWRGKIDIGLGDIIVQGSANTDGLGLLVAKRDGSGIPSESWTKWSTHNGYTDQGADGLINKGFRYYAVNIANGIVVDVYVLHMDADDGSADIEARNSQLTQLANYIKSNKHGRPIIIIGDSNCRYNRDKLKTNLIDAINADSRLTIKDVWVEHMWGGEYPAYGSGAMMTDTYGEQKGEVVDKIFYINDSQSTLTIKANSYFRDATFDLSDHAPVIANFTLTDPNGEPVSNELAGPASEVVLKDETPTAPTVDLAGKTFYLKNVASGLYLKAARGFGSQASEGVHAMPMTFNKVDNDTYYITHTIPNCYLGDNLYLDNGTRADWDIKEIVRSDGAKKYILYRGGNAIASEGNGIGVGFATYNATDTKQHWMLYTDDMIKKELAETVEGTFYNASTLIPYGRVDTHHADTRKPLWQGGPSFSGWSDKANHTMEKHFWGGENQQFDVYQEITGLPQGTYTLTAQAFHRSGDNGTSVKTVLPDLYATNGSRETFTIKICSVNDASAPASKPDNMHQAGDAFLSGSYNVTLENVTVGSDGKLRIGVRNTSSDNSARLWCCFNNFQLLYHGTAKGDLKGTELYKGIKAAVEEANALVATQSAEVKAAYDISPVVYRYNNDLISTDGAWELALIDNAVMTAVKSQSTIGADMSLAIVNNSFEKGSTTGWTIAQQGSSTNAIRNEGNEATANGHGVYQFNTWSGWEDYGCGMIYQDITGLRNGYYKLNALVASWGHKSVYLVGNKQSASIATIDDAAIFVDFGLDFIVEDGTARIGAVGAGEDGNLYFKKGIFFKADNFRLTYMGSIGEGRVKCALADAKAKADKLHEGAKNQFYNAVAQYETDNVKGDGKTEEAAIYNALKAAIATQPRTETDMTWLIANPGFETGDWTGWNKPTAWEAIVAHATNGVAPGNGEGQYIVNVWNNQPGIEGSGVNQPTYQTLKGLPNGRYRLTADVASDGGNQVCVYATGSQTVNGAASPENNATFVKATVEFEVTGNADVTIGAVGLREGEFNAEGGCWYKCDNFRLTYLGHEGTLSEGDGVTSDDWYTSLVVTRTMKKDKWNTFVVPFDMAIPEGWEVKELTSSTMMGDVISLEFSDAETIEAGVAYMVRVGSNVSSLPTTENVQVNTTLINPSTDDIEFVGVYEAGNIPKGSFFISNNQFYQAADNSNRIKAFRAYLKPINGGTKARSLSYRFDGEEGTTSIEEATEEVTVVGIYTPRGVRIDDMQQGINVLHMSNGTTMKIIIK